MLLAPAAPGNSSELMTTVLKTELMSLFFVFSSFSSPFFNMLCKKYVVPPLKMNGLSEHRCMLTVDNLNYRYCRFMSVNFHIYENDKIVTKINRSIHLFHY